ncbi:MAG: hypothetical protein N838_08630 [Thiohalocapsa sp. PB-PSB1]|jgi:lipopolysaccharide biosynthesis protein|nr:MAG: hypothetical protein N838_08630 [Thiohalocapsa sp. PB-PSB1]
MSQTWPFELFPGVMNGWDNTPRNLNRGAVFAHASPGEYRRWLRAACDRAVGFRDPEKRLVFVNAWNEWAEGAYLEPDRRYGFAYLRATSDVLSLFRDDLRDKEGKKKRLSRISWDCCIM